MCEPRWRKGDTAHGLVDEPSELIPSFKINLDILSSFSRLERRTLVQSRTSLGSKVLFETRQDNRSRNRNRNKHNKANKTCILTPSSS